MNSRCCQNRPGPCPCVCDPIVMPEKVSVCNRYFQVEQPIICPQRTRIVNHYVPRPVYYHTYTQEEEVKCEGKARYDEGGFPPPMGR